MAAHLEAEQPLWEVEATAKVLGTTSLPGVDAHRPDSPRMPWAFVNAHRWTRLNRLRESDDLTASPSSASGTRPSRSTPTSRSRS